MKKLLIVLFAALLFTACGGGSGEKSGSKLANGVCDCFDKANAMNADDPKRHDAQADCVKLQGKAWSKVKDNQKEADEFNKILSERSKQ